MKKRTKILLGSLVVVTSFYIGTLVKTDNLKKEVPLKQNNQIAMYLENEDGGYDLSSQNKFPTEGYVLNTEKSTCKNGGTLTQDPMTKKLSLTVSNSDQCTVYFDKEKTTIAYGLKANSPSINEYAKGDTKEMYTFDHDETTQTTGWSAKERRDYRYIGSNPNNYITFNNETWRIIGVFTVETEDGSKEQLMKIIRNNSIGNLAWASDNANEWHTASLKTILNGDYYNQSGSYSSTSTVKGLSTVAQGQIENVKWYLGGFSIYEGLEGSNYYNFERETTVWSVRTINILQKIGLMYPSDYVYTYAYGVNQLCYTDSYNCKEENRSAGWLYDGTFQWTITPYSKNATHAFYEYTAGFDHAACEFGVRPTVYLKSDIQIKSGTGASDDPYIIAD